MIPPTRRTRLTRWTRLAGWTRMRLTRLTGLTRLHRRAELSTVPQRPPQDPEVTLGSRESQPPRTPHCQPETRLAAALTVLTARSSSGTALSEAALTPLAARSSSGIGWLTVCSRIANPARSRRPGSPRTPKRIPGRTIAPTAPNRAASPSTGQQHDAHHPQTHQHYTVDATDPLSPGHRHPADRTNHHHHQ